MWFTGYSVYAKHTTWLVTYSIRKAITQGVQVWTLGRQNERNNSYVRLAHTSIFGLCLMPVCLMKLNCYSLIYSSLLLILDNVLVKIVRIELFFSGGGANSSVPSIIALRLPESFTIGPLKIHLIFELSNVKLHFLEGSKEKTPLFPFLVVLMLVQQMIDACLLSYCSCRVFYVRNCKIFLKLPCYLHMATW